MKRTCFTALILSALLLLTACTGDGAPPADTTGATPPVTSATENDTTEQNAPVTTGNIQTEAPAVNPENKEAPQTLKILAIGNSFSTDGMQYLYDIAKSAGVKNIVLGNLYIGGCSLATHLSHAKTGDAAYTYYKNNSGTWVTNKEKTLKYGLNDEKWDYVTFQQTSKTSGLPATYGSTLTELMTYVKSNMSNPDATLVWHMTWAYQQDSTHSSFPNYKSDQMTMYNMIVDTVEKCIVTIPDFKIIIPAGTAIQNARTSFTGDRLTRDGYHLNYNLGRYIAGLTWYAAITGAPVGDIKYNPAPDEINADVMAMAKAAVTDAVKVPLAVTKSTYTTGTWKPVTTASNTSEVNAADCYEADLALAKTIGIDLTKYRIFEYEYKENAYWYCTKGVTITVPGSGSSTYRQNVCTAKIYSQDEIPVGSLIICDAGWQYRPELWQSATAAAKSRPAITTANITLLDAKYFGDCRFIAFNISSNPKSDISAHYPAAVSHVRVYVPVS